MDTDLVNPWVQNVTVWNGVYLVGSGYPCSELCQRVKLKPGDEDYASRTSTGALIHRSSRGNWPGTGGWLKIVKY